MIPKISKLLTKYALVLTAGLIIYSILVTTAWANNEDKQGLFIPVNQPLDADNLSAEPAVSQTRYVRVDFGQLSYASKGENLYLNLFPGEDFNASITSREPLENGGTAWVGVIDGIDFSQMILVVRGGQITGNISMPGAFYRVRHVSDGIHAVEKIDQSEYPPELGPIPVELPERSTSLADSFPQEDEGVVVDVLVVYTPQARLVAGGTTAMENLINLAVVETNQSYANSGISHRIKLVNTTEVDYIESGNMYTDLNRLTLRDDGYLEQVHALRDAYNADIVTMIEESYQYCGIAWLMTDAGVWFEPYGFNIVARNCATGYYSFGHEIGHNMGARHDWYVDDSENSPYSFNKGYVNVEDRWRTIMAYNSECSDQSLACTRLHFWSNPDVTYWGDPMGVPIGTSTDCDRYDPDHPACDADNRQTLNNTAPVVADFRAAQGVSGPVVFESYSLNNLTYIGEGVSTSSAVCGSDLELDVVLENEGNFAAEGVQAQISTSSGYVAPGTMTGAYPDIPGLSSAESPTPFTFSIDGEAPLGHVITVDINITSTSGGPWFDSFEVPVICDAGLLVEPDFSTSGQLADTVRTRSITLYNSGNQGLTWEIVEQGAETFLDQSSSSESGYLLPGDPAFASEDMDQAAESLKSEPAGFLLEPGFVYPSAVLHDNGPFVNSPGTGYLGADESLIQNANLGMITYGYGHQYLINNRIADEFIIAGPDGWTIDAITFFGYQTGSTTASPFLSLNYRIWNGKPGEAGSVIVYGDTVTNKLQSSSWTGAYRVFDSDSGSSGSTVRPIMANQVSAGVYLPPGTYWLDWQANGNPNFSGPWAPPITINGQPITGNAVQYTVSWDDVVDTATLTPQGFPFIIEGTEGGGACITAVDIPWLTVSPTSGAVSPGEEQVVQLILDSTGLSRGIYTDNICISTNDTTNNPYILEVTLFVGGQDIYIPFAR